ncbi:Holliday junction branch migration protein RuvA [Corynebacterium choanae]|uniref:Holliday junction branch migration complex subunit RuvA n=1 Tax=Corynebacterium choanae TaxID=1862358 RepID=A0A3G6J6H2_9CORY|nr:Holliday junction branch migration protein RuvA [Corynebacterium choanae]AZA13701.1 Holliday junction ATP-dependent DNA helicase RuvA [Corynebacterium choanae]
MIASLRGQVLQKTQDKVILECGGVGYQVFATPATLAGLQLGQEGFVYTSLVVREDGWTLYGFSEPAEIEMFLTLQSVKGMGAKYSLAALSVYTPEAIAQAIMRNEPKALKKIPGVGERIAQRLCLELADKVDSFTFGVPVNDGTVDAATQVQSDVVDEVLTALHSLGFQPAQVEGVVADLAAAQPDATTPVLLKAALKSLGK